MSIADRTCRTCGKTAESRDDLFSLFDYTTMKVNYENELKVVIEEFDMWNLNIAKDDGLPQQICITCFDSFCQVHNFRILCLEAQMNFGEMCTGLDIFIKDDDELFDDDDDIPLYNFQIQEHYKFPGDELLKPSLPASQSLDSYENKTEPTYFNSNEDENSMKMDSIFEEETQTKSLDFDLKKYRCEYCLEIISFDDPELLNDHYNKLHTSNEPYTCSKCDKRFDRKSKRNSHFRSHFSTILECDKCGKKIKGDETMMKEHHEYNHIDKDRQCPICLKKFEKISFKKLEYHMYWHDDSKLHKCKFCPKKFIQTTHLAVHERTHDGEYLSTCRQCNMSFHSTKLLELHVCQNGAPKPYKCSHCPKQSYHSNVIHAHMQLHRTGKNRHCEICNITYRSNMNFRLHNYRKHGAPATQSMLNVLNKRTKAADLIKPYKCNKCPEAFILHTQLIKHLKIHNEDRPYKCTICPKRFKRLPHMKLHVDSTHLNKRAYKCSMCGWAFPQITNLKEHFAAKHSNKKDFKCEVCSKEFATRKGLKTHMLRHSEEKPFVCTVCNKGFKRLPVLENHMNRHLLNNEADLTGADITDIVIRDFKVEDEDTF